MAYSPSASTYGKYIDLQNYNTPGAAPENSGAMWMSGTDASPKLYTNIGADFGGDISGDSVTVDGAGTFGSLVIGDANVTEAQLEILDGATVTTTELNFMDGDSSITAPTVEDGDGVVFNDDGTMKQVTVQSLAAYFDDEITNMPNLASAANLVTVGTIGTGVWQGTAVARAYIAADAIDGTKIDDNAVDSDHIALGALDSRHYASGSIEGGHIAADALDSQHYAAGSIDNEHLANDAVGADELAANAVVNASIASNAAIDMDKLDGGSLASSLSDLAQGDLMYAGDVDDSNNLKSITFGNLEDAIFGNVSGDATIASGGALTIASNAVQTGMVHDDVATELAQGAGLEASSGQMAVSAAQTSITSIINASLGKLGTAADEEYLTFGTANEVNIFVNDTERLSVTSAGADLTGDFTVSGECTVSDGLDVVNGLVCTTNDSGYALTVQEDGFNVTGDSVLDGNLTLNSDDDVKAGSFITYSDAKLKTNVETVTNAMDMIQGLRGVSYDLKSGGKREFGFIAQEVNTVVPEVVSKNGKLMGIDYTRITSLLVEAVKTQQAQIENLKAKLDK